MGTIHQAQGDRARALEYFQQAAELSEELGMKSAWRRTWSIFRAASIRQQGSLPARWNTLRRSEAIQEEIGDKRGLAEPEQASASHGEARRPPPCRERLPKSRAQKRSFLGSAGAACACLYEGAARPWARGTRSCTTSRWWPIATACTTRRAPEVTQLEMQYEFDKKEAADHAADRRRRTPRPHRNRSGEADGAQRHRWRIGLRAALPWGVVRQRNRIGKGKKARSEELLLNILPEEVAEELKAKGSAEAVHIDQVTVLFTDFKGFTAMSETLSPQELVRDLNECFSAFDRITEKHGIEKIKTIGDAYMAAGGLPTPNNTHATDVIKAAFEMNATIAEAKERKVAAGLPYFEVRIGIHTGPVVAGIVGVKKFSYDIWGDTVNTASRMESSGEVGQVNISEATYAMVKDASTPG
ncbi:MAG: hypothetical protein IPG92_09455 [Flavobacteriales bacterium]|nr:hypothetical protein [Flavobacteriales bacterium]